MPEADPDQSATTALALADPPVIRRLRMVFSQLADFTASAGNERTRKYSWLMQSIMEEVLDELADNQQDETRIALYFAYFGRMVEWCGSGDENILPPELRKWLHGTSDIHTAMWGAATETEAAADQPSLFDESEIPALTQ